MDENKQKLVEELMAQVEECLSLKPLTPKEFEHACRVIEERTKIRLSRTTLMRMWGYVREQVSPRLFTLTTLAKFCGYADWTTFVKQYTHHGDQQSNPVMEEKIEVLDDLSEGDIVCFTWRPGRVMEAQYHGEGRFEVIYAERTRLRRGTSFLCYLIIKGEPLFLSRITIGDMTLSAYVCGKVNGVQFEVIKKETGRAQQRHTS